MSTNQKRIFTRIINKHDTEANWQTNVTFIPMKGEVIIYDEDESHPYERIKIGNDVTPVNELPFIDETLLLQSVRVMHNDKVLSDILSENILDIDYSVLSFDTSDIVFDTNTSSILGQAMLGQLVLA